MSSEQVPLTSLVMAIPLIVEPGFSYETIEVKYEWQPPNCETCKVLRHFNDQCPKQTKEVSPTIDTEDGIPEVIRKGGKGKQKAKSNQPISGFRVSMSQTKYIYRAITKNVDNDTPTSKANNGKTVEQRKSA